MNVQEIRMKSTNELNSELSSLLEEQFKLRMQKGTGQLATPHDLRRARRDIARLKTIIGEKKRIETNSEGSES
jgi:large subunit ribosomal protein L29